MEFSQKLLEMEGHPPAFHGRQKPGFKHEINVRRRNGYEDCKEQFRQLEAAGVMSKEMKANAVYKMRALKAQSDAGLIKTVDFGKIGHPLEKDSGEE